MTVPCADSNDVTYTGENGRIKLLSPLARDAPISAQNVEQVNSYLESLYAEQSELKKQLQIEKQKTNEEQQKAEQVRRQMEQRYLKERDELVAKLQSVEDQKKETTIEGGKLAQLERIQTELQEHKADIDRQLEDHKSQNYDVQLEKLSKRISETVLMQNKLCDRFARTETKLKQDSLAGKRPNGEKSVPKNKKNSQTYLSVVVLAAIGVAIFAYFWAYVSVPGMFECYICA